jgi:integrase
MEEQKLMASTWDKWLYGLRGLFAYAKDYLKALPQGLPTECELIRRKKSDKKDGEVFTIKEIVRIGSHLPDQETALAFALVLFGHVRQEEVVKLGLQHFTPGQDGIPNMIRITKKIAKHKNGESMPRDIAIEKNLKRILAVLLPKKGSLFVTKNVYGRIRAIAKALGVPWRHNALRHSCDSHDVARGTPEPEVAAKSGHTIPILRKHYLVPVDPADAIKYWRITFNRDRLSRLPRFRKSQLEKTKRVTESRKARVVEIKNGGQRELFTNQEAQKLAA